MRRALRATRIKIAMVAVASVAVLALSRGVALADDTPADWGFGASEQGASASPGSALDFSPALTCDPQGDPNVKPDGKPCSYSRDMHFRIQALNGTAFADGSDDSVALLDGKTRAQVGTCTWTSDTELDCTPSTTGTMPAGDSLITADSVEADIPQSDCDEAVISLRFYDVGTDVDDDLSAFETSSC